MCASILGIDESNHGRFPEIIVAVYSTNPFDANISESLLGKVKEHPTDRTPRGCYYRHLVFGRDHKYNLGDDGIKMLAILSLIHEFSRKRSLDLAIRDGGVNFGIEEVIQETAHDLHLDLPIIQFMPQADQRVPIVNRADQIARLLGRYYQGTSEKQDRYKHQRIYPVTKIYDALMQRRNITYHPRKRRHSELRLKR